MLIVWTIFIFTTSDKNQEIYIKSIEIFFNLDPITVIYFQSVEIERRNIFVWNKV